MAHTNEEIYLSSLCDRIMAFCNRLNKRLDVIDEQQRLFTYTDSYAPLQYPGLAYVTPWQTTAEPYFDNQPQPYFHNQLPPSNDYHQPPQLSSQQPPQPYQQPLTGRATQTQPRQQFPQPNSCWYPPTQQLHTPPQYPSYTGGPTTYSGYELYKQRIPQPPDPAPPYGAPTYGLPGAQPQKQDPIQPAGQPPYTGQPATGWCPLTSHHHSAAPLSAAAVPSYRGCPMEAIVVPDEAVVVEEVQDKSSSEVMLFNSKSYDEDEMLMVVPPPLAAISMPCSPDVRGEEKRTDAFLDVDIIEEPIYTMLEVMEMVEDENSLVFHANGSHFESMCPLSRWLSMEPNGVYNWTEQSCTFDPGGNIYQSFDRDWKKSEAFIGTRIIIQIRCHAIVGYWCTKQRSCAFDPGGYLAKLLLSMILVAYWFPP